MLSLYDLIPDNSESWIVSKNQLLYKKTGINLPISMLDDNIAYIYIDNNAFHKPIIKLVKYFMKNNIEFYFYPPTYSNPGTEFNNNDIIYHYLLSYANENYYNGFEKIEFSIIDNLVAWTLKEKCFELIILNYKKIQKKIQKSYYDHYTNKKEFKYPEYIRDEFNSLYREIKLNQILK